MSPSPKTVLDTILQWSQDQPRWQRDAIRRIVVAGQLGTEDIEALVKIAKAVREGNSSVGVPLDKKHLPANPASGDAIVFEKLEGVKGANMLAKDQSLVFQVDGMTIVYGDNGAGKSGYARVMKRACRARHRGRILGNVYQSGVTPKAEARFTIRRGTNVETLTWTDSEEPDPVLSAVSVFDSDCAGVHIASANDVAFRPFGIDIPDALADACKRVRILLEREKMILEQKRNAIFNNPPWSPEGKVARAVKSLTHDTKINKIEDYGSLTEEDELRLKRLKEDLAKDIGKAAKEQEVRADCIRKALEGAKRLGALCSDRTVRDTQQVVDEAVGKRKAAKAAAQIAFAEEELGGIGGTAWRAMWHAARLYSESEAYPQIQYPNVAEGSKCVLCQQDLTEQAKQRMRGFEKFIRDNLEREAQSAEKNANESLTRLKNHSIRLPVKDIAIIDQAVAKRTRRFAASVRLRRAMLLKNVKSGNLDGGLCALETDPVRELAALEEKARMYAAELKKASVAEERKKLEIELLELSDRAALGMVVESVKDEVRRLQELHLLKKCIEDTRTNRVTQLANSIADEAVTPKLRDRFQKEIVSIAGNKVRVELVRVGGKTGTPHYRVKLFSSPTTNVADVLSEG